MNNIFCDIIHQQENAAVIKTKNMSPWQHDFQSDTVQVHFSRVSWGKYLEVALREEGD